MRCCVACRVGPLEGEESVLRTSWPQDVDAEMSPLSSVLMLFEQTIREPVIVVAMAMHLESVVASQAECRTTEAADPCISSVSPCAEQSLCHER